MQDFHFWHALMAVQSATTLCGGNGVEEKKRCHISTEKEFLIRTRKKNSATHALLLFTKQQPGVMDRLLSSRVGQQWEPRLRCGSLFPSFIIR